MKAKRILCYFCILTIYLNGNSQSFYEKIMVQNIDIADTSNDWKTLEMGAYAMQRVSKGVPNNWPAAFHVALCFVRSTDLLLQKHDTVLARSRANQALSQLNVNDTIKPGDVENSILHCYAKINALRLSNKSKKDIALLESSIEGIRKKYPLNPRIYVVLAYHYKCFYGTSKTKRKKAIELLEKSESLFDVQKANEFDPSWGRKWATELTNELKMIN